MSKYQDAFEYVLVATNGGEGMVAQLKTLEKLVDKATPKKPIDKKKSAVYVKGYIGNCPNCGKFIQSIDIKPNQCECRQEIDWSEE